MILIPAIDLLDGKAVRLKKGDYQKATVYNDHPLEEARKFKDAGFNHIHMVDLNGAKDGEFTNLQYINEIISELGLSVQVGGGIRSYEDARKLLDAGVSKFICSSMAVKNKEDWLRLVETYPERAILGMDLKEGEIAYGGWLETAGQEIGDFLEPMIKKGLKYVLTTDISRDGMLSGPNIDLYRSLQQDFPDLDFIASGGVSGEKDLEALQNIGVYGAVVGRAYYEGKLTLQTLMKYHTATEAS